MGDGLELGFNVVNLSFVGMVASLNMSLVANIIRATSGTCCNFADLVLVSENSSNSSDGSSNDSSDVMCGDGSS